MLKWIGGYVTANPRRLHRRMRSRDCNRSMRMELRVSEVAAAQGTNIPQTPKPTRRFSGFYSPRRRGRNSAMRDSIASALHSIPGSNGEKAFDDAVRDS